MMTTTITVSFLVHYLVMVVNTLSQDSPLLLTRYLLPGFAVTAMSPYQPMLQTEPTIVTSDIL